MNSEVTIRSVHDGTILRFSDADIYAEEGKNYLSFAVSLEGPSIQATEKVDGFESRTLASYFEEIAESGYGWRGEKLWSNLEDELKLTATSDKLGHVYLSFTLRSGHHNFAWMISGCLVIELGQLNGISKEFSQFYEKSAV